MANAGKYKRLFEPGFIGRIKTKNRFVRTGAGTDYVDKEGVLKIKQELPFYKALARGGVGLIIMGNGLPLMQPEEKFITGYREITNIAHDHGCPIFTKFAHLGAWCPPGVDPNQVVSASSIPLLELKARGPDFPRVPRELTVPKLRRLSKGLHLVQKERERSDLMASKLTPPPATLVIVSCHVHGTVVKMSMVVKA